MLGKLIQMMRGWEVKVYWEDRVITHFPVSWSDALAWASCYPIDANVIIRKHGKIVSARFL